MLKPIVYALVLATLPQAVAASSVAARHACVTDVLDRRDAAFETLQFQLTRAVALRAPGLSPAAKQVERGQIAMRAASTARVTYLMETQPDVLDRPITLSALVNIALDDAQLAALRRANPSYVGLEQERDRAIAKTRTGVDMDRMRGIVQSAAADPDDLGATLVTFGEINAALEQDFQACLQAP